MRIRFSVPINVLIRLIAFSLIGLWAAACDPMGTPQQVLSQIPTATAPPTLVPTQLLLSATPMLAATPIPSLTGLPTIANTCRKSAGQVIDDTFTSQNAHGTVAYRIYLPPCYWDTSRRYPYVILLHSGTANDTQWVADLHVDRALDKGITSGAFPPLIAIMPNDNGLQGADQFHAGASFATLITDELIPTVEKRFCTWGSRDGRTIGGLGNGGFWAYVIGLQHPELFTAIGAHSPAFTPNTTIQVSSLPANGNILAFAQIVHFASAQTPRLLVDSSLDDPSRAKIDLFAQTLTNRQIVIANVLYPSGLQNSTLWAAHINDDLAFYSKSWPHSLLEMPSCLQ